LIEDKSQKLSLGLLADKASKLFKELSLVNSIGIGLKLLWRLHEVLDWLG
jgi:hypothetical protein